AAGRIEHEGEVLGPDLAERGVEPAVGDGAGARQEVVPGHTPAAADERDKLKVGQARPHVRQQRLVVLVEGGGGGEQDPPPPGRGSFHSSPSRWCRVLRGASVALVYAAEKKTPSPSGALPMSTPTRSPRRTPAPISARAARRDSARSSP